ncbi:MAG: universal stress protein [Deltaproteobacteria bacterium]|nr:MAG: universal stress protein [Deltaproteobacteria bacterium]
MPYYRLSRYSSQTDVSSSRPVEPIEKVSSALPHEIPQITYAKSPVVRMTTPDSLVQKDTFTFEPSTTPAFLEPYEQLRTQWSPYEKQMLSSSPLKILIGYEGVFSERSLALGFAWARRYHAQVLVVNVLEGAKLSSAKEIEMLESIQSVLEKQTENSYFKTYPPKVLLKTSPKISEGLVQVAQDQHASMIVLATHGKTEEEKLRHGSVAEEVLKNAPCPVLIGHEGMNVFHPQVIVAPIDFSPFTYRAIAHSIILSKDFGSHLYLFHTSQDKAQHQQDKLGLENLMVQMNWQHIDHELVVESGNVVNGMIDFCATHKADLIVVGTHRVDYDKHTYANSLVSQLIERAPCPVLVVHPEV